MVATTTKVCSTCTQERLLCDFHTAKRNKDGYQGHCKSCQAEKSKLWKQENHERAYISNKAWELRTKYGMSIEEYDELLALQDNKCACCQVRAPVGTRRPFNVDHDHGTGRVRGILCPSCNSGIGHLSDSLEGVLMAVTYLRRKG